MYPKVYGPDHVPPAVQTLVDRLLPALLEGAHPALACLRQQLRYLRVAKVELTGAGFYVDFEVAGEVPLADPPNFAGGGADIRLRDFALPAGCVLFVRQGRIATLEGYTYGDDEWSSGAEVVSVEHVLPVHPG